MYIQFVLHNSYGNMAQIFYKGANHILRGTSFIEVTRYVLNLMQEDDIIYVDIAFLGLGLYEELKNHTSNVRMLQYVSR